MSIVHIAVTKITNSAKFIFYFFIKLEKYQTNTI